MLNKKPQISIGIPAFNEQDNIKKLLKNVLNQKGNNFSIKEIIIVSDQSTDNTINEINSIGDKRIRVLENKKRLGQALSQNKILESFTGDVLILLNADIMPKSDFITNIIKPIINSDIDLVGAKVSPLPAKNFFESIINHSASMKQNLYESVKKGQNIYMCHGRARAFSRRFAKKFKWQAVIGEDAYSYLSCIANGYKFQYCPEAEVLYRSPQSLKDHLKQSVRFFQGKKHKNENFKLSFIINEYYVPLFKIVFTFLKYLIIDPVRMSSYIAIILYARMLSELRKRTSSAWDVSASSKQLELSGS